MRPFITALIAAGGLLLCLRAWLGPFHLAGISLNRPLNLESGIAVLTLLALFARSSGLQSRAVAPSPAGWRLLIAVLAATGILFFPALSFPLISDDYVFVTRSGAIPLADVWSGGEGGASFRPVSNTLFLVQGLAGLGTAPLAWHLPSLLMHLINCGLVFLLARRIATPIAAALAAFVFGVHATRSEAVAWLAARTNPTAALFVLLSLNAFARYPDRRRPMLLVLAGLCTGLACLSNEIAYATPLLALCWLAVEGRVSKRNVIAAMPLFAVAALAFTWRWLLLGGIGGYVAEPGRLMYQQINPVQVLKAIAWRCWAIFFYPVNWTGTPSWSLSLTLASAGAAYSVLASARVSRLRLSALVAFTLIALFPALPLALVGQDLWGARVYYVAGIGFALLLAAMLDGLVSPRTRVAAAVLLAVFHTGALLHEFAIRSRVTRLADRTCSQTAATLRGEPVGSIVGRGLPVHIDGVFFLFNGFPECLAVNGLRLSPPPAPAIELEWDDDAQRVLRAGRPLY